MNQSVGKRFPDLELTDHEKNKVKISEIAGKFPIAVIFYRGYW
jgi:peroxiredoxin|tara:strand:- start:294 stop:422 length:129 start_codon:yes stop_codon:yes gene_type:complete